ncbi:unnamed protein product [Toxocara canis]|uniref:Integron gene cassette protein n=1 Tax=Toxocara canis TaxID=6265 RepID=A0A183V217_TOXCA|nr:unnamed protein product [Toxocara canis]
MAADSNVVQRAVSRAAAVPPRSSMGERLQSRMGTAQVARPPTSSFNRSAPPGTSMRPITQQGLTGVRAPSRLGSCARRAIASVTSRHRTEGPSGNVLT